jgi:group I intron endonuclease
MNCGIYTIENVVNGKKYYGSTNNWNHRKANHLWMLRKNKHDNVHLQRAWNKYGETNFRFVWVMNVLEPFLTFIEQIYINENKNGYNINIVANKPPSSKGKKLKPLTEEHKAKLKIAHTGKKLTEEHKEKMSASRKLYLNSHPEVNWQRKGSMTAEHKANLSLSNRGQKRSTATREKMRQSRMLYLEKIKGEI